MGVLIKSSVPYAADAAERRQQIKDLVSDCPALTFVQTVENDGLTGFNNHYDEYTMPYAGDRRLRFAYYYSNTSYSYDGIYIMNKFSGDINSVLEGGYQSIEYPSYPLNYLKCYEADRGLLILSTSAITSIRTDTSSSSTFQMIWGTSEEGGKWCYVWKRWYSSSGSSNNGYRNSLYSNIVDERIDISRYFYNTFPMSSMPAITLDNVRRHDMMMQCLEPLRVQDGQVLSGNYVTPVKMRGYYNCTVSTVTPSTFDIYTDQITGKRYLVLGSYLLMEITS